MKRAVLVAAAMAVVGVEGKVQMPYWFSDGMVIQSNKESGALGRLNGLANPGEKVTIKTLGVQYNVTADANGEWVMSLNPKGMNTPPSIITVEGEDGPAVVANNVLYGDVFFCSGQSNMQFPLGVAFNATEEAKSLTHPAFANMRFFQASGSFSPTPQFNLQGDKCEDGIHPSQCNKWVLPGDALSTGFIMNFSAVCYLTARDISRIHNMNPNVPSKPVGLVHASWGGTRIEAWMPESAFADCSQWPPTPAKGVEGVSGLYNAMVNPFRYMAIRAVFWYQGEANAGDARSGKEDYACYFQAMIRSWRGLKRIGDFGFLAVSLAPSANHNANPGVDTGFPEIRLAQQTIQPRPGGPVDISGVAITMDLGGSSSWGFIHPPNKNEMARRLAMQAVHAVYGVNGRMTNTGADPAPVWTSYWTGPVFESVRYSDDKTSIVVAFDGDSAVGLRLEDVKAMNINGSSNDCLKCCKGLPPFEVLSAGTWVRVSEGNTVASATQPTVTLKGLPTPLPTAVRYAHTDYVDCVLVNSDALPATVFATNITAPEPTSSTPVVKGPPLRSPPLGWNSWNYYHCNIDEVIVRRVVDAMVSNGMRDAGYRYVNIDDCWMSGRHANGSIIPDSARFPSGMKALADYAHSKGMKFGLYTARAAMTCMMRPGSYQHEAIDAQQYCDWGVDYVKIDSCYGPQPKEANESWVIFHDVFQKCYNDTGNYIVQNVDSCTNVTECGQWIAGVANTWGTGSGDIQATWSAVRRKADWNNGFAKIAKPGHFNDADMLEIGNPGMTEVEWRSHMSLWCIISSPLLAGTNVIDLDPSSTALEIMTNQEAIAVNQDLGRDNNVQGTLVDTQTAPNSDVLQVWAKPLSDGSTAVVLLNCGDDTAHNITVSWASIGAQPGSTLHPRDLWLHKDLPPDNNSFTATNVAPHASVFLRFTP